MYSAASAGRNLWDGNFGAAGADALKAGFQVVSGAAALAASVVPEGASLLAKAASLVTETSWDKAVDKSWDIAGNAVWFAVGKVGALGKLTTRVGGRAAQWMANNPTVKRAVTNGLNWLDSKVPGAKATLQAGAQAVKENFSRLSQKLDEVDLGKSVKDLGQGVKNLFDDAFKAKDIAEAYVDAKLDQAKDKVVDFFSGLFGGDDDDKSGGGGRRRLRRAVETEQLLAAVKSFVATPDMSPATADRNKEIGVVAVLDKVATLLLKDTALEDRPFTIDSTDPLVLDLLGDGIDLIPLANSPVMFDMTGTGQLHPMAWVGDTDGFLCRDLNGNGRIDSGRELFSEYTSATAATGLQALAQLDSNKDGRLDAQDPDFARLLVWQDTNANGLSEPAELRALASYDVEAVTLSRVKTFLGLDGNFIVGAAQVVTNGSLAASPRQPQLYELALLALEGSSFHDAGRVGSFRQYTTDAEAATRDPGLLPVAPLLYADRDEAVDFDLADVGAVFARGSELNDQLRVSQNYSVHLEGGGGNDTLTSGAGRDVLDGGPGFDTLRSGPGDDIIFTDGLDDIQAGPGRDVVLADENAVGLILDMAAANVEVVFGSDLPDLIYATLADDTVRIAGGAGDDVIVGSAHYPDVLDGGLGDDLLDGGESADDVAVFYGSIAEYRLEVLERDDKGVPVAVRINHTAPTDENEGVDTLLGIEKLVFVDHTLVLNGRNNRPIIEPLRSAIRGDENVTMALSALLRTAREYDGDVLKFLGISASVKGGRALLSTDTVVFLPQPGFEGRGEFAYLVSDGKGGEDTGHALVNIKKARPRDEFYDTQWYLDNIGALEAWDDYTGKGVLVVVCDEGAETDHPDYKANYDATRDYDYTDNDNNPDPGPADENHGSFVTGLIVAQRNDIGVIGVAHEARTTNLRGYSEAPQNEGDVINNSWGSGATNKHSFRELPSPLVFDDTFTMFARPTGDFNKKMLDGAAAGRNRLGTVHVASAGNTRGIASNTNLQLQTNSRFSISVAAYGPSQDIAYFSTPGASVHITGPGIDMTSTDRIGDKGYNAGSEHIRLTADYASGQGTSYSSPVTAGVVALMLQAKPTLGWRDVSDIFAITARHGDLLAGGAAGFARNGAPQRLNGGGFYVSHDFGFGLLDARASVRLAETWDHTPARTSHNEKLVTKTFGTKTALLDLQQVSVQLTITEAATVMHATSRLVITHPRIGDLVIELVSPAGTRSILFDRPFKDPDNATHMGSESANIDFEFMSVHCWGESSVGTWTLTVSDNQAGMVGTLDSWRLDLHGDPVSPNTQFFFTDDFEKVNAADALILRDTGGTDLVSAAACSRPVVLNLYPGAACTVGTRSFTIDSAMLLENAIGGDDADRLVGNRKRRKKKKWRKKKWRKLKWRKKKKKERNGEGLRKK